MGMLMIAIGIGFFGSIIVFFIAEEMSLKDADFLICTVMYMCY